MVPKGSSNQLIRMYERCLSHVNLRGVGENQLTGGMDLYKGENVVLKVERTNEVQKVSLNLPQWRMNSTIDSPVDHPEK